MAERKRVRPQGKGMGRGAFEFNFYGHRLGPDADAKMIREKKPCLTDRQAM